MGKFTHIKQIKGSRSLYGTFLYITLLPLIIFGIVMTIYSSITLTHNVQSEVSNNLRNIGISVLSAYDVMYEGDYNVMIVNGEIEFYKGNTLLTDNNALIDSIKAQTDVDISLFFYDTRVLTTITNEEGDRFVNTGANTTILKDVIANRNSKFYPRVQIGDKNYFAYYQPIISKDGETCLGMIGMATPIENVSKMIRTAALKNIPLILLALVVTAWCILHFTSGIVTVIKKIMKALTDISEGNFSLEIDPMVISRTDELGEMGRLTGVLRASLRKLVEKDALTGIYNRRYGQKRLEEIMEKGIPFSVAISDIDFFKKFNDKYGHDCGDIVLKEVAKVLSENMRTNGYAARWGGEEFLLVFENNDGITATITAERILNEIRERIIEYNGEMHLVTMSMGVCEGDYALSIDENIKAADERLYLAKESGRNRVCGQ